MIYTFWEGEMPSYIKLCMMTWKVPFTILNYKNLLDYTDLNLEPVKRFTLPQIADVVRVHVLRDRGGYWLDADTIMIAGGLPDADMVGDPEQRINNIGFLFSNPHSRMFTEWADYQDGIINGGGDSANWAIMGNAFTDVYVKEYKDVRIHPAKNCFPETYMIPEDMPRYRKYQQFYFQEHYTLSHIIKTDLLMLHNSWTPGWYKKLTTREVLSADCTMSNILKAVL